MMSEGPVPGRDDYVALLRWYADMGIDAVVDQTPHDRFSEAGLPTEAPPREAAERPARDPLPRAALPARPAIEPANLAAATLATVDDTVRSAREIAAACRTLSELRAALESFEGCNLKRSASRLVFGDGNPQARIMAVGEAPGVDEDRQGVPFVGRSGQLFDRMLASIGLDRTAVYITNVLPWRPPGNRTPTPQETATCLPFLLRHLELVGPDYLLCLGAPSAQTLLGIKEGILRARGRWTDVAIGQRGAKAMPMLHPAYLLRFPGHKRLAWRDLLEVRRELDGAARPPLPPTSAGGMDA